MKFDKYHSVTFRSDYVLKPLEILQQRLRNVITKECVSDAFYESQTA